MTQLARIITISGTPGSGKSTVAKIIQQKLQAERIYVGGIRREIAREKNMTLEELNDYAQTHPETDVDVDKKVASQAREMAKEGKQVIVEGRTQYHFLPESVKIFITVSLEEGAKRILKDLQQEDTKLARNEAGVNTLEEMKEKNIKRIEDDSQRYEKYYQIDPSDQSNYDFVLDTTNISAEEAASQVLEFVSK